MFPRFFIDRPIFATVLSAIVTLTGAIALVYMPVAQYPRITPPGIVINISYPGASAQEVADTVGAPIEQYVNGVEGMLYMSSQSGNDGTYSLSVTFDIGTDLKTALVKVQNRVALAMPLLPSPVQNQGITVRKKTPDLLLMISFYSPDGRYDDKYLSNFATIAAKDELLRVDGVADLNIMGQRDYSMRAWLDPQKLASRNMTAVDVANAIMSQNTDAPAGRIGQPPTANGQSFQLPLDTLGRLKDTEQFAEMVIKIGGQPTALSPAGMLLDPSASGAGPAVAPMLALPVVAATAAGNTTVAATSSINGGGSINGSSTVSGSAVGGTGTSSSSGTASASSTGGSGGGVSTTGGATTGMTTPSGRRRPDPVRFRRPP
ncbi:efflux RND transporter permease subunit [Fimbriiglobus ruber]|uniref:RND efflux system, inner membrane transporter CmeB n=1 Tax=Fimbriiglobus ruber TaxID=1908690 RepID=A0A225DPT5_9BACT|nr:efflux RND transporter permease subunit [Fimbriiglobus ruber]OWK43450.1 RND efflux system, inner membrane transporter CmeB [Fimbriiglobus ruber]